MIRVLITEDSPLVSQLLSTILCSDPEITVVGIAKDGFEAIQEAKRLKPDLITMDLHMPRLDGVEAIKQIMAFTPTPILILSSSVLQDNLGALTGSEKVFKALSYGALDIMEKEFFEKGEVNEKAREALLHKVKLLSHIQVITHPLAKVENFNKKIRALRLERSKEKETRKIIGIASSTGGPQALADLLASLPKEFPVPILIVQHIAPGFVNSLADWLNTKSSLKVKVAENHEEVLGGNIYIAPSGLQMQITSEGKILLVQQPLVDGERPSGTVLLKSIAEVYGSRGLGIILTGMGKDGAEGIRAIYEANGFTIAQDEKSSVVYGMPQAAINLKAVHIVLPLPEISAEIMNWLEKG